MLVIAFTQHLTITATRTCNCWRDRAYPKSSKIRPHNTQHVLQHLTNAEQWSQMGWPEVLVSFWVMASDNGWLHEMLQPTGTRLGRRSWWGENRYAWLAQGNSNTMLCTACTPKHITDLGKWKSDEVGILWHINGNDDLGGRSGYLDWPTRLSCVSIQESRGAAAIWAADPHLGYRSQHLWEQLPIPGVPLWPCLSINQM